jgi:hypothetical protein
LYALLRALAAGVSSSGRLLLLVWRCCRRVLRASLRLLALVLALLLALLLALAAAAKHALLLQALLLRGGRVAYTAERNLFFVARLPQL